MAEKLPGCPGAALWPEDLRKCSECGCIHHNEAHGDNWYCDAMQHAPGYDDQKKTFRPSFCPALNYAEAQPKA